MAKEQQEELAKSAANGRPGASLSVEQVRRLIEMH